MSRTTNTRIWIAASAVVLATALGITDAVSNGCLTIRQSTGADSPYAVATAEPDFTETTPIYALTAAGAQSIANRTTRSGNLATASMMLPRQHIHGPVWAAEREWAAWQSHLSRHGPAVSVVDSREGWLALAPVSNPKDGQSSSDDYSGNTEFGASGWLQRATVWTEPKQEAGESETVTRCQRASPLNFHCDTPSWSWVRWWNMTVRGRKDGCIWTHPLEGRITHIVAPIPERRGRLRIRTALYDGVVGDGGTVQLVARIGDRSLVHRHPDKKGWRDKTLTTGSDDELHVEVSSESVGRRHFCFDLAWTPESELVPDTSRGGRDE